MVSFKEISLSEFLAEFGEDTVSRFLSGFVCTENKEVEEFIRTKAIGHEKRGLARTILIFDSEALDICGFYTISTKSFVLGKNLSSSIKKKYFGSAQTNGNIIPSILIGQLGKNEGIKSSFTGSHLMDYIFRYIEKMSELTPSMICYVEHDGRESLVKYYEKHDFIYFPRETEEKEKKLFCHIIKTKDVISKVKE